LEEVPLSQKLTMNSSIVPMTSRNTVKDLLEEAPLTQKLGHLAGGVAGLLFYALALRRRKV
jgi:hypothetical protein